MDPLEVSGVAPAAADDGPVRDGSDDGRMPVGFAVAAGAAVVVVAAFVTSAVPASAGAVRLGVLTAALGGFAAATVDVVAVVAVGVIAFLLFDGFLVNQLGELSWHGGADVQRLFVFIVVSIVGLIAGTAYRALREWRRWRRCADWVRSYRQDSAAEAAGEHRESLGSELAHPQDGQPSRAKSVLWNGKEIRHG